MNEAILARSFPSGLIDLEWRPFDILESAQKRIFLHRQRDHLKQLIADGIIIVKEGHSLYINYQGLIAATEGGPLTEEELKNPSPEMTLRASNKDKTDPEESPLAAHIMEDLGTPPPLKCRAWRNIFYTLNKMPSSQRTARALVNLLQPAIQEEEESWAKLATMGESFDTESISYLDFDKVRYTIYHLAGEPHEWNDPTVIMSGEWLDLSNMVKALSDMHCRIVITDMRHSTYYDDTPNRLRKYKTLWKLVMRELRKRRMGIRMQAYVDELLESSSFYEFS